MRHILVFLFLVAVLIVPWLTFNPQWAKIVFYYIGSAENELANVILTHSPKSISEIKSKYFAKEGMFNTPSPADKVKILIVPGHEPDYGGAEYADLFERDMTVDLAMQLKSFLSENNRYEVYITRDKKDWTSTFSNYFKKNWNDIIEWTKSHVEEINRLSRIGEFHPVISKVIHNVAPRDIAYRLYGISKWSNENDVDIIIHVHFNDHPGHAKTLPGDYSGFAIYVPQDQYYNSTTTQTVAKSIFNRLKKYNPVSNFPGEKSGIVETQDLIAVGAYNSIDAASMLIEYGYIYEPQFNNKEIYDLAIKDLAFQTYLGLQDFFDDHSPNNIATNGDSLLLPHTWNTSIVDKKYNPKDVYSLQTALMTDGMYPPSNRSLNDCPRSGNFGNCTKSAVEIFQKRSGIKGEGGMVGQKTIEELNKRYSVQVI